MRGTRIGIRAITAAIAMALALGGPAAALAQGTPAAGGESGARVFELPGDMVYPEGVTYDGRTGEFYVGSTGDGTIFRGDVVTGEVEVFSEGGSDGRTIAVGMKIDGTGKLFVAGGPTGMVWVYDTRTGDLLASFANGLGQGETFLNDIALTSGGDAYVTDSLNPVLYRVLGADIPFEAPAATPSAGGAGATPAAGATLEPFVEFEGTALQYVEGFNLNGIVATPDGAALIVVQGNTGALYHIDIASQAITEVDLAGETVTGGDGMLLAGQTLHVVNQGQITPVELDEDFLTGTVGEPFADPSFQGPTTIAMYGSCLLVVNAQFAARESGTPELPFTVVGIPVPAADSATPVAGSGTEC